MHLRGAAGQARAILWPKSTTKPVVGDHQSRNEEYRFELTETLFLRASRIN